MPAFTARPTEWSSRSARNAISRMTSAIISRPISFTRSRDFWRSYHSGVLELLVACGRQFGGHSAILLAGLLLHIALGGVVVEVEAQRQVGPVKLAGQRRKRIRRRNAAPRSAIERYIAGGRVIFIPATLPSGRMANSIDTLPRSSSGGRAASGMMLYQFMRTACSTRERYGPKSTPWVSLSTSRFPAVRALPPRPDAVVSSCAATTKRSGGTAGACATRSLRDLLTGCLIQRAKIDRRLLVMSAAAMASFGSCTGGGFCACCVGCGGACSPLGEGGCAPAETAAQGCAAARPCATPPASSCRSPDGDSRRCGSCLTGWRQAAPAAAASAGPEACRGTSAACCA